MTGMRSHDSYHLSLDLWEARIIEVIIYTCRQAIGISWIPPSGYR
jgi:hypothetical protein